LLRGFTRCMKLFSSFFLSFVLFDYSQNICCRFCHVLHGNLPLHIQIHYTARNKRIILRETKNLLIVSKEQKIYENNFMNI
jgi:hypothetical protein